jgi:glycosyltransferase involved in cell wall biosynthesis
VSLIWNAVDLEQFRPDLDAERMRLRQRFNWGERFVAAHIGNMSLAHDFDVLLDAAAALPEFAFVLAGGGSQVGYIEQRVQEQQLDNVVLTGILPHAEMPGLFLASDVCLIVFKDHPLFNGALPSKMFEAMATGTPIVAAIRGEAEALLRQTGAGIPIPIGDREAMIEALRALANSPEQRRQMGVAGRVYAEEHLSPLRVKESFLRVFRLVTA